MPHRRAKDAAPLTTGEGREARVREVVADVAFRLLNVCGGLPPDEFVALVRRIAEVGAIRGAGGTACRAGPYAAGPARAVGRPVARRVRSSDRCAVGPPRAE
jgi:hypothetical protein